MNKQEIRQQILNSATKSLQEFGYSDINTENILTDQVYKSFFKEMLKDSQGQGSSQEMNEVIDELLSIVENS